MGPLRSTAAAILMSVAVASSAADCITDLRMLSTRASAPNLVAGPAAWTGTALPVAKLQESATAVWVGVYDEDLNTLVSDRGIAADARSIVALLWSGSELGLFYRTTDNRLLLQRLTTTADPIGAPVAITPSRRLNAGEEIEVKWSGALDAWVVARNVPQGRSRGIWITVVDRNGTERSDQRLLTDPPARAELALAVTPSGVVGVYHRDSVSDAFVFTRLTPGGNPRARIITNGGRKLIVDVLGELFVVVRAVATPEGTEVRWFTHDSSAQIVRDEEILVRGTVDPLALVVRPEELALTYTYAPSATGATVLNLRRFTPDGSLISDSRFAGRDITAARALNSESFVWTGSAYMTTAVRQTSERLDSYLLRYCPLRVTIFGPRRVPTGVTATFTSTTGGGVPGYQYAWTLPTDGRPFTGATVQRAFVRPGSYVVRLTVTDSTGVTATDEFRVEVFDSQDKRKQRVVRR